MAKIIRLTESDLTRIIRRVVKEQSKITPVPILINRKTKENTSNQPPTNDDGRKYLQGCQGVSGLGKIDINQIKKDVNTINQSTKGIGTNEQPIYNIFNNLEINGTFIDFCNLRNEFNRVNGQNSFDDLLTALAKGWENFTGTELTGYDRDYILKIVRGLYNKWLSKRN